MWGPLQRLLTAELISGSGNRLTLLAIPWFVLETTGDPTRTGLSAAAILLPSALATLFSGVVIDRRGAVGTSVTADLFSAVFTAAIPFLNMGGWLTFETLLVCTFFGALFDAPGATARTTMIPDISEASGVALGSVMGYRESVQKVAQFFGAAAGGILIASVGAATSLWLNAASFLVSAAIVRSLRHVVVSAHGPRRSDVTAIWKDWKEGFDFLVTNTLLRSIVTYFVVANLIENAVVAVLLPSFAEGRDNPILLGAAVAALGAGGLVGAVAAARMPARLSNRKTIALLLLFAGPPKLLVLAADPNPVVVVALFGLTGLLMGPINPVLGSIEFRIVPSELRGRVFGLLMAAVLAAAPAGTILVGYALDVAPLIPVALALAALYLVASFIPVLAPGWRDLGRDSQSGTSQGGTV